MRATDDAGGELDRAISLYRRQNYRDARAALQTLLARDPAHVTAWNVLGYLEGDIGEAAAAAAAFDRALALDPRDPIALKGRARMALERAEPDVLERYRVALNATPGDSHLVLEQAEARISAGDFRAIDDFAKFVETLPNWTDGQIALARMLRETRRDEGFADHVRRLLAAQPRRLDLWRQFIDLLSACDRYEAAADAAREARVAVGGSHELAVLELVQAGWAGDLDRAEALLATIPANFPGRAAHEANHFIRRQELERARIAIDAALADNPVDMGSWAIAELLYRKLGDPRALWLSGQEGLVRTCDLALDPARFGAIKAMLLELHRTGVEMAGQSVRAGTQTRWRLFHRLEPELADLKRALDVALADYVAGLPPADPRHPLLRHRDAPLTIAGSWSVRLTGGGHHVSHVHPHGLISSACYFITPEPILSDQEGALELGHAPEHLLMDLEPLFVIVPKAGQLTLFPSYLHHGTRPFAAGERLAVAFDVIRHLVPPV